MKTWIPSAIGFLLAASLAVAGNTPLGAGSWIDLTHAFSEDSVYWPTADTFKMETAFEGETEAGFFYCAYNFCAAEHGGTHMDAPVHFARGRKHADEVPVDQLIGPAVVIDVSGQVEKDRDYQVDVEDFTEWEASHGRLPEGAIVLLLTGNGKFYPDKVRYMGTDQRGPEAVADLHFPGLHPAAAKWLTGNRNIKAIGLDTPSIDFGQSTLFESHRILFEHDIPAFENVANLHQLPVTGATVIALPMKIKGGSGAPLRIIAFVPTP